MTAPDRIYINKIHGQHPEDWNFTDGQHLTKRQLAEKVEYVRADLVDPAAIRDAALREVAEMVSKEAATAREVFEDYGSKAKEAVDYMEQLLLAALRAALKGADHE